VDESEGDVPADAHPMASRDAMARAAALRTLFDPESAHQLMSESRSERVLLGRVAGTQLKIQEEYGIASLPEPGEG
jgi:hypothetical protein